MITNEMKMELDNLIKDDFKDVLFSYIDASSKKDSEIYKAAGIDRRKFSKIRCNSETYVSFSEAISLALALNLNLEQTRFLLSFKNYSLYKNSLFNTIVIYCIENKIFDLGYINECLYSVGAPLISITKDIICFIKTKYVYIRKSPRAFSFLS